jgi:hypothetical protein
VIEQRIDASGAYPVVVWRADAESVRELEGTGARLRGAAHPGVVRVLASAPAGAGGWELRTDHGGTPLAAIPSLDPVRLAAIGAAVATTLADLHEQHLVHGRLTAGRVLVGAHDRPVLCGFGAAPPDGGPEIDVAAMGALLRTCLPPDTGSRHEAQAARRLGALADEASDPEATRRPSMRRLAAALAEVATTGAPSRRPPLRPSGPARRLASPGQLAALAFVIVALAVGAWKVQPRRSPAVQPVAAPTTASDPARPTATTSTTSPPTSCAVIGGATVPRSAGCPHDVVIHGGVVTIDGVGYRVGEPDDVVAVGSWRCAGDATIAVLRPSTGAVFAFPAATGVALTVEPVAVVPGGASFEATSLGPRCQELVVVDGAGASNPVSLRPAS